MGYVIWVAYGFPPFQFSTHNPCCLAAFDFDVRVPEGATKNQFERMLQNLLLERFKLAFHYQQKEMAIYELTVGPKGPKLPAATNQRAPDRPRGPDDGCTESADKDGYPVFPAGVNCMSGLGDYHRWTAFDVSTEDIAKTLSDRLHRPVADATGLDGKYNVDLKWVDLDWRLSESLKARVLEEAGELGEEGSGPTLARAVQDQLGLKLSARKGSASVVVIDHVEKVPTGN